MHHCVHASVCQRVSDTLCVLGARDAFDTMERIARLKSASELLDVEQITMGFKGLQRAVSPAADGRVWLPSVLLMPRRMLEALPILSIPAVALWLSAALAWSTESFVGVPRCFHTHAHT